MTMGTRPYSRCGENPSGCWGGWYGDEEKNARGGAAATSRRGPSPAAPGPTRLSELDLEEGRGVEAGSGDAAAWCARARAEEGVMAAAASRWGVTDGRGGGSEASGGRWRRSWAWDGEGTNGGTGELSYNKRG